MDNNYIHELNEYKNILFSPRGIDGIMYLKKRNITPDTAKFWNMGFCPKDYMPECYRNSSFRQWKKMQGRIIFPVFDQFGNLIAMSGRTVFNESPKYIHYQFPTRKTLFGLYQNKDNIFNDNMIFFVEGQLDVITAWQKGFRNCVCTFGSHFSSEQIAYASRYCSNIGILYDNDEAGKSGAETSFGKLKNVNHLNIKIFQNIFPENDDVDSWISKGGDFSRLKNQFFRKSYDTLEILKNRLSNLPE